MFSMLVPLETPKGILSYQIGTDLPLLNTTADHVKQLSKALGGVTINAKGKHDIISDGEQGIRILIPKLLATRGLHS